MNSFLFILQVTPTESITSQLEKIGNPILSLLLMVLFVVIYFLYKQIATERETNTAKDEYIKEQNKLFFEHALKNVEVMQGLQHSIEADSANHKVIEDLLRENNNYLRTLSS